jgi:DNA-binding beta-propeller fold protein YncE
MKKNPLLPPIANLATAILGIWKLKSREDVDSTGQVRIDPFLGRDPVGILCFGPIHFAAQFIRAMSVIGLVAISASPLTVTAGAGVLRGIVFDPAGNLFAADNDKNTIIKFSTDGKRTVFASGLKNPLGLACDKAGNLFVSDNGSHSIIKFSTDGRGSTFATGVTPTGLAFDAEGNLFAADVPDNNIFGRIVKFSPEGKKTTFAKTGISTDGFSLPAGPAIDRAGNLFVSDADKGSSAILKFTPDGNHTIFAAGLGNPAYIVSPFALAVDAVGNLFLSASEGAGSQTTIYKFTPDGNKTTFAKGLNALGLAVDNTGNLFASDEQSASIVKVAPDGTKSRFAAMVSSLPPDSQWEYRTGLENNAPGIVKAGAGESALDLSEDCDIGCSHAKVLWAPNSKLFAFVRGDGKERLTSVYQLREGKWVRLKSLGDDDEIMKRANSIVDAQAKKHELPKNSFLHQQFWTVEADRWIDTSTLTVHASLAMQVHRNNGEFVDLGFGTDLLFTLRFDDVGSYKIVKTHQLSEKEAQKFNNAD